MNDLLVLILAGLLVLVILLYFWKFVLYVSPLRLLRMVMQGAVSKDIVDPNAPIEHDTLPKASQALEAEAQMVKQQGLEDAGAPRALPRARITPEIREGRETTSDSGYPLPLDPQTQRKPRPFLDINYGEDHQR